MIEILDHIDCTCFQCDLVSDNAVMEDGEMDKFCRDHGFLGWFETSAKENINIETSCRFLIDEVNDLHRCT